MTFINEFKNILNLELEKRISIKSVIDVGYLSKNYFDTNISKNNFYKLLSFFHKNNKLKKKETKSDHYFYKDLELVNINDNVICIQKKNVTSYDFINTNLQNSMKNYGSLRIKFVNNIKINNIYFPSYKNYNETLKKKNNIFISTFYNSEIKIIFEEIENKDSYHIYFTFHCDQSNIDNTSKNLIFLIKKIHKNINFSISK